MGGFPQYAAYLLGGQSTAIADIQARIGVKSVQRGVSASAGTATITAVNTAKSTIISVSKGSAGTVATNSTVPNMQLKGATKTFDLMSTNAASTGTAYNQGSGEKIYAYGGSMSGGTTNLVAKQYSAVLTNATTVTFDGPCEWEVVEYN